MTPAPPSTEATDLTEAERDFQQWMEKLDLEEVNLLGSAREIKGDDYHAGSASSTDREELSGERKVQELPPSRDLGWDVD